MEGGETGVQEQPKNQQESSLHVKHQALCLK